MDEYNHMLTQATEPLSTFLEYITWVIIHSPSQSLQDVQFFKFAGTWQLIKSKVKFDINLPQDLQSFSDSIILLMSFLSFKVMCQAHQLMQLTLEYLLQVWTYDWQRSAHSHRHVARERCSRASWKMPSSRHVWQVCPSQVHFALLFSCIQFLKFLICLQDGYLIGSARRQR